MALPNKYLRFSMTLMTPKACLVMTVAGQSTGRTKVPSGIEAAIAMVGRQVPEIEYVPTAGD